jgi:tyrosine-protein phosphatase YwqE
VSFFNVFKKVEKKYSLHTKVDIHSHLLFGLDDGAETKEQTLELLQMMVELGYQKMIFTPHIMSDFYKNNASTIVPVFQSVQELIKDHQLPIQVDFAAEYYLDEVFVQSIEEQQPLLSFGNKYLLFETSFLNKPVQLHTVIFKLKSQGYKPILAHPERYTYMYDDFNEYLKLKELGVYFQLNLNSLTGYYSPKAKQIAEKLIDHQLIDFIGSDCHHKKHLIQLKQAIQSPYYQKKLAELPLLNNSLL